MIAEHLHTGLSVGIVGWLEPQLVDTYTYMYTVTHIVSKHTHTHIQSEHIQSEHTRKYNTDTLN